MGGAPQSQGWGSAAVAHGNGAWDACPPLVGWVATRDRGPRWDSSLAPQATAASVSPPPAWPAAPAGRAPMLSSSDHCT